MILLVMNRVRSERRKGRDFLVAATTLIVPGVLSGSAGALLYPASVVGKNPEQWNGKPLTLGHPVVNGRAVPAATPGVRSVGQLQGALFDGTLRADSWLDVEATRGESPQLLDALNAGKPVEVSTGLFTEVESAWPGANWQGVPFVGVVRSFTPDHLAILTGSVGACAVRDGCGLLV